MPNWVPVDVIGDDTISARPCWLGAAHVEGDTEEAILEFFDGDPLGTGEFRGSISAAAATSTDLPVDAGGAFPRGLYVQLSGLGATAMLFYRPGGA